MPSCNVSVSFGQQQLFAGSADFRCAEIGADHPWMLRLTVATDDVRGFQEAEAQPVEVRFESPALVSHARVVAGRLHLPGPSIVDLFGEGPCPVHVTAG